MINKKLKNKFYSNYLHFWVKIEGLKLKTLEWSVTKKGSKKLLPITLKSLKRWSFLLDQPFQLINHFLLLLKHTLV